ncbi:hypothetical protein LCGC14_0353240 [marine sediment metagenome]|uniref:Uncharacterized protein n=1 Tax=marine sediment metagenome TaxID=412755 RepID=A0A0F9TT16_9ZZZZ
MAEDKQSDSKVYTDDRMELWDVYDRQITQEFANYNTLGGTAEKACANCQWYIAPSGCVVVQSSPEPIVPNGLSNQWKERVRPTSMIPIPVVVVDMPEGQSDISDKPSEGGPLPSNVEPKPKPVEETTITITVPRSLKATLLSKLATVLATVRGTTPATTGSDLTIEPGQSFVTFKDMNDQWRWFAWTSNKFRDRDNPPEIFEDSAHKDYVEYLDEGGKFPELWLWHQPGTRWGQADWVDYSDGLLMHSGTIDPGFEDAAKAISDQKDWGVSHGYHYLHSDEKNGIIGWYRDFELSPLPMRAAANVWTGIAMLKKELGEMGFNKDKRETLVGMIGEDIVAKFEGNSKDLVAELDRLGVEYKGLDLFDGKEDGADTPTGAIDYKQLGEEAAKALAALPAFTALTEGVDSIKEEVTGVKARLDLLEKTDDEKIAAKMAPQVKVGSTNGGYKASSSGDNIVDKDGDAAKEGPAYDFFNEVVEQVAGPATGT